MTIQGIMRLRRRRMAPHKSMRLTQKATTPLTMPRMRSPGRYTVEAAVMYLISW